MHTIKSTVVNKIINYIMDLEKEEKELIEKGGSETQMSLSLETLRGLRELRGYINAEHV